MPVDQLQHVNIRCADVEAAKDFYLRVVGLTVGPRPPFQSVGYWMYAGGNPVVHLVQRPAGEDAAVGPGNLDHVGFRGVDLEGTRAQLRGAGVPFREQVVPGDGTVQIFVVDPNGLKVELNF
ncbi:MAG TPA: VOC family protein [Vicinamibacterales bacterium]|nr:VOC family protein [Vicinamibacterales bacterium]